MNYREKLLRQQNKNQVAHKEQEWDQERQILQADILNLQNSTDIKILEQTKEKLLEKTRLLDKTIEILGKEDIGNLTDISNLLTGKTLKELANYKTLLEQKIKAQDTALLNLARSKIKGKKEAEALLN